MIKYFKKTMLLIFLLKGVGAICCDADTSSVAVVKIKLDDREIAYFREICVHESTESLKQYLSGIIPMRYYVYQWVDGRRVKVDVFNNKIVTYDDIYLLVNSDFLHLETL